MFNDNCIQHDLGDTQEIGDTRVSVGRNDAYRNLWASVLYNALDLATSNIKRQEYQYDRASSRRFILTRGGNFNWICGILELNPALIQQKMIEYIERSDKLSAEARKNNRGYKNKMYVVSRSRSPKIDRRPFHNQTPMP